MFINTDFISQIQWMPSKLFFFLRWEELTALVYVHNSTHSMDTIMATPSHRH